MKGKTSWVNLAVCENVGPTIGLVELQKTGRIVFVKKYSESS